MNKIIGCKFILIGAFSLVYSTQIHSQQQPMKKFEGYYQFTNDTSSYLQITSQGNNLILYQLWDGKEISFERKSELEFLNEEHSFPLNLAELIVAIITQQTTAFNNIINWYKVKTDKLVLNK